MRRRTPVRQTRADAALLQELTIERVGVQGDGIAAGPVYAPFTLPGERVRAKVLGDRAEVLEILAPSLDRADPVCPHFLDCGGCALQHWAAGPYLDWKSQIVREALARERIETEILAPFASPPGSRRRLALHARPGDRGEARLGYKTRGGWRLVEIEVCPIADPRLQAAFPALRRLAAPFLEHPRSAPTLHATWTDGGLDVDVTGVERRTGALSADARLRAAEAGQAGDMARVTLAGEGVYLARRPSVRLGRAQVDLPAGAFLQATPEAETAMGDFILGAISGAGRVADLFSGVGTFSFRLAEIARTWAVDSSAEAITALQQAAAAAPGLKEIAAEARDLFRRPVLSRELKRFEAVVFDPPRAGAEAQAAEIAASGVCRVVGVSCNPATFARDARVLIDAGFRLKRVLPVDQFLWSPHVELVGVFER